MLNKPFLYLWHSVWFKFGEFFPDQHVLLIIWLQYNLLSNFLYIPFNGVVSLQQICVLLWSISVYFPHIHQDEFHWTGTIGYPGRNDTSLKIWVINQHDLILKCVNITKNEEIETWPHVLLTILYLLNQRFRIYQHQGHFIYWHQGHQYSH